MRVVSPILFTRLAVLGFLLSLSVASIESSAASRGIVIEDFESGSVILDSYPDQDAEPSQWQVTASNTFGGSAYALRLYGNTWKTEEIPPYTVGEGMVWQVAVYSESLGEMQGFGVSDGTNELLYTVSGSQLPVEEKWWTVYQGAFPQQEWYAYLLPIGDDWFATYGYYPTVTRLVYVNDDDAGQPGVTLFDEIHDVTDDLPIAPQAVIQYTVEQTRKISDRLFRVGVQFQAKVFDPDSESHTFLWDFGDSTGSTAQNPTHEFLVEAEHTYTVGLLVRDPGGLAGHDTCQVQVEPGGEDLPITVNFVGDIMTGRQYEYSGGIIDTYGIEALYEPTLSIFGDAADVNVCNLEVPYTDRGSPHPTKSVVFRARPENITGVAYAGIDLVTLGNNHIVDYGEPGMLQTMELLDGLNIGYSGAGVNSYFALQPTFWTERGVRIGFLGQCNRTGRQWNYQPFLDAGANKPGFGYLLPWTLESSIAETRENADVVIIQLHSGDEYDTAPPPARAGDPAGTIATNPPPVEAAIIGPADPDFTFRIEPTPGERDLRRLGIDLGADIVINHHPHVLQGFESYNGKLIAHSLGNFIFDLYYPETMPTIVLTLEMDKEGIFGYRFTPVWIDDFIPQPATGMLGREIMDRMADYSTPMGALVAVDPGNNEARIYLARTDTDSTVTEFEALEPLTFEDGIWITPPIELEDPGSLSRIVAVDGPAGLEVCWGREILWHGGFEEEGATFWYTNSADEWLDDTESRTGARSLALRRDHTDPGGVGTDLEKHLPSDPDRRHSAFGWVKSDNASGAVVLGQFFSSRYSSTPVATAQIGSSITGTQDWSPVWGNFETPPDGIYFEMRCENEAPLAGTGHAWFDDLKFIEWEPWVPVAGGEIPVPSPNNCRFVQVRSTEPAAGPVRVRYEKTVYGQGQVPSAASAPAPVSPSWSLSSYPNPFHGETRVEIVWGSADSTPLPASLQIYDIRGRRVATLLDGTLNGGGVHEVFWNGTDDHGRLLPTGVYFTRARIGQETRSQKVLVVR